MILFEGVTVQCDRIVYDYKNFPTFRRTEAKKTLMPYIYFLRNASQISLHALTGSA